MSRWCYSIFVFLFFCSCSDRELSNRHYPSNHFPLMQTRFVKLPLGSIKPTGWLENQLQAQADALTGHLDEFWPDLMNSAWRGGGGESWERTPYYLDGLVPLAFILEDQRLLNKAQNWVKAITQTSQESGWFGPPKNNDRWPLAVACKVLIQYYEATGDPQTFDVLMNYFNYLHGVPPDWPDSTWRGVRAMEHAVSGYWLFRRSKDPKILETIESIVRNSYDWTSYYKTFPWDSSALYEGRIPLNWKADGLTAHVVNNAMAIKYPGLWYQQSGAELHKNVVFEGLRRYDLNHGQVGGRFSGDEHLCGKRPTQGTELCAVVELMFSLENLLEIFGDTDLADRLELLAYNALPGAMTADCWAHQYDQQANQVIVNAAERDWTTNGETSNLYGLMPNYPCCLANLHQGWPKLVQHMWMASHDQGLVALIYGPCSVTANVADGQKITILQETNYPFEGTINLNLKMAEEILFPLHLRIPEWAEGTVIQYRNKKITAPPGTYVSLKEKWKDSDRIQINFPMDIRTERRYNNSVSILRGPVYYSLRIGKNYRRFLVHTQRIQTIEFLGSRDWEIFPTTPWNYGLLLNKNHPALSWKVTYNQIGVYPFADIGEMVYSAPQDKHHSWPEEAAVVITIPGRKLPDWNLKNNSANDPAVSPVESQEKIETLYLVPYGSARLRITEFPLLRE